MGKTEAIVLKTSPYGDYNQIVTFYTQDFGLLKCAAKHSRSPKNKLSSLLAPFNELEIYFLLRDRDLETIQSAQLVNPNLPLRHSLETLSAASLCTEALLKTQMPGKSSPLLYALLKKYLELVPEAKSPEAVSASFILKLLKHEGLLSWENEESFLPHLDRESAAILLSLGITTSGSFLKEIEPPQEILQMAKDLFAEHFPKKTHDSTL